MLSNFPNLHIFLGLHGYNKLKFEEFWVTCVNFDNNFTAKNYVKISNRNS